MPVSYQHILVPLDGSPLAEVAVSHALALARACGAEVTFLNSVSPMDEVMVSEGEPVFLADLWKARQQAAQAYLESVAQRPEWRELKTHGVVETSPAADAIVEYARRHAIDVIVMATHGRSGFRRWVFGSVAEKVLRGADRPVLMVRAHGAADSASPAAP